MGKIKVTLTDSNQYRITFRYTGHFTYINYLKVDSGAKKGHPVIIDGYPVIKRDTDTPFMTEVLVINDVDNTMLTKGFSIRRPDEQHDRSIARGYALLNLKGRVSNEDLDLIFKAYENRNKKGADNA